VRDGDAFDNTEVWIISTFILFIGIRNKLIISHCKASLKIARSRAACTHRVMSATECRDCSTADPATEVRFPVSFTPLL